MQPFLRYRSAEYLWGLLNPRNPADVVPASKGTAGEQKFPLGQSIASAESQTAQPWTIAYNRKAEEFYYPSKTRPQREQYYNWGEGQTGLLQKPSGIPGVIDGKWVGNAYDHRFDKGLYPLGAMVLAHHWSDNGFVFYPKTNIMPYQYNNFIKKRKDREVSDIRNYLFPAVSSTDIKLIIWNCPGIVVDGWGEYYVNYNKNYSFPMHQNGTSIFVGDGKISMNDLSVMFRTAIISMFKKDSLTNVPNENPYNILIHSMDNLQMLFKDRNGVLNLSLIHI